MTMMEVDAFTGVITVRRGSRGSCCGVGSTGSLRRGSCSRRETMRTRTRTRTSTSTRMRTSMRRMQTQKIVKVKVLVLFVAIIIFIIVITITAACHCTLLWKSMGGVNKVVMKPSTAKHKRTAANFMSVSIGQSKKTKKCFTIYFQNCNKAMYNRNYQFFNL